MRMDCRLTVVFAGQIRSKAFIRKYAIKRLTPFNANPDLVDAYLALFRHQHNGEVGNVNRFHEACSGQHDIYLMNRVDDLSLPCDGKVCLPSFREWLAPLTRLPSVFVIVPLSSTIANAYNITPTPAPDSQRLRDTIKQPLSYFSRTIPIGTRYNFGPISSSKAPIECVREDRKRELRKPERDCWTKYIDDRQEANIAMAHLISRDRGFWAARKSQPWWP